MTLKEPIFILITMAISSWFTLLLAEYTIRKIYPSETLEINPDIYEYDPLLGYTFKKNTNFIIRSPIGKL